MKDMTVSQMLASACGKPTNPQQLTMFVVTLLGISLQPNGLRVLSTIPGLVESLEGRTIERLLLQSVLPEDPGVLANSDAPTRMKAAYGYGMFGVRRSTFHRQIVEFAEKSGVKIVWSHTLVGLEQHEGSVTVKFENGNTDTASFVVGCDGLHSGTRIALFGKEDASFTGLVQVGGNKSTVFTLLNE